MLVCIWANCNDIIRPHSENDLIYFSWSWYLLRWKNVVTEFKEYMYLFVWGVVWFPGHVVTHVPAIVKGAGPDPWARVQGPRPMALCRVPGLGGWGL